MEKVELTVEEALQQIEVLSSKVSALEKENADLTKESADLKKESGDLKDALEKVKEESADEIEALKLEIEAVKEKNADLTKEVPGFYTHKEKNKSEVKYRFKKGRFNVVIDGQRISAKEALASKEVMEKLIELGSGSIEIFK